MDEGNDAKQANVCVEDLNEATLMCRSMNDAGGGRHVLARFWSPRCAAEHHPEVHQSVRARARARHGPAAAE